MTITRTWPAERAFWRSWSAAPPLRNAAGSPVLKLMPGESGSARPAANVAWVDRSTAENAAACRTARAATWIAFLGIASPCRLQVGADAPRYLHLQLLGCGHNHEACI